MRSLYEELAVYLRQGRYPFHMPGHKGNPAFLPPEALIQLDVTELENTDNLHGPRGCIAETQRRIAALYGADQSFLLVNGSTAGIVAAIGAVCEDGDMLAVARNCHRAVFSGMVWSGAIPVYFMPENGQVSPRAAADVLDRCPQAKAMVMTSPTYEGIVSDIKAIADIAHSRDCVLIVDEAHGAHFPFHEIFPQSALLQGADIVIHSFHKTLPAFSQSAVVHVKGKRVDVKRLSQCLTCVQTSSPSYMIMAATDYMLDMLWENSDYFEKYVEKLLALRKALKGWLMEIPGADIGKLVLAVSNGRELANEYGLAFEMVTDRYTLAMTSVADTLEGFNKLEDALDSKLAKGTVLLEKEWGLSHLQANAAGLQCLRQGWKELTLPKVVISPREAMTKKTRTARLADSMGEVSGSFLMPYPPGIPVLVPGELVTESLVEFWGDCEVEVLV